MGKDWDAPWKVGAGMSKPGIGDRAIPWPTFGGNLPFGGANPSCSTCGGRLRGAKKCSCDEPTWMVDGEPVEDGQQKGHSEAVKQKQLFQAWCLTWLRECQRVLQPGGIIKVFGGTRMKHRMEAAVEAAGFLLLDEAAWVYGSGFPKSLDLSKAMDKLLGGQRPVVGTSTHGSGRCLTKLANHQLGDTGIGTWDGSGKTFELTAPDTQEAQRFSGWGTALKPAWEPFVVGQKLDLQPDQDKEREIQSYLRSCRETLGLTKAEVDRRVFGGTTRYSWVEGRGGQRADEVYLPTPEEWLLLKDVLHLDDRYDAYIQANVPAREQRQLADGGRAKLVEEREGDFGYQQEGDRWGKTQRVTRPQSEGAQRFSGWGTALKPAWEPFVVGKKP